MATSRATIRKQLAQLLENVLGGSDGPVALIADHQIGDFQGQSPVVVVSSAGSRRVPFTFNGWRAEFFLNVDVFTLYADPNGEWTEADAEDAMDAIEQRIAALCEGSQRPKGWESIGYADRTTLGSVIDLGGSEYKREQIPLIVHYHG